MLSSEYYQCNVKIIRRSRIISETNTIYSIFNINKLLFIKCPLNLICIFETENLRPPKDVLQQKRSFIIHQFFTDFQVNIIN
jgi:hypothetical protein